MQAYLSRRDVFVSAPIGAGKSLTFELAPASPVRFSSFAWRGLQYRLRNCSTDFTYERSGL